MPTPVVHAFPVRRPDFITDANWVGDPNGELQLDLTYIKEDGNSAVVSLPALTNAGAILCLPTTKTIMDLSDDLLVAHLRMAGMIPGYVPGSTEYSNALTSTGLLDARYYQTPIGDVKVLDVSMVSDTICNITFQKSNGGPTRVVPADVRDLARYSFIPSTQLLVVAGSVRKQYPTYIQDPANNKILTPTMMNNIKNYVLGLELWV